VQSGFWRKGLDQSVWRVQRDPGEVITNRRRERKDECAAGSSGASNFDWGVSDGRSRRGCTASSSFCLETNDPLQLIRSAIALPDDQASSLVPCLLVLKTYPVRHFSLCRGFLLTSYRCIRPFSQASLSEPTRMRSPKKPATRLLRRRLPLRPGIPRGRIVGLPSPRTRSRRICRAVSCSNRWWASPVAPTLSFSRGEFNSIFPLQDLVYVLTYSAYSPKPSTPS
jgi:hypothetical protein